MQSRLRHPATSALPRPSICPRQGARLLGGDAQGNQVSCPGPGHSRSDRSLSVRFVASAPEGFVVHSFSGDDPMTCRDHVRDRLGLPDPRRDQHLPALCLPRPAPTAANDNGEVAGWLWHEKSAPLRSTLGERYLREGRGLSSRLPPTIRYLPPDHKYPPTLITAFAIPDEPEPSVLDMTGVEVRAVHLTRLTRDGSRRSEKAFLGSPKGLPLVVSAWTDSLGLMICEGIEDALSAYAATGIAAWAAGSATHMPKLAGAVPNWCDSVALIEDANRAGRDACGKLKSALRSRGLHVDIVSLDEDGVRS